MRRSRGFGLIETLTALAITAIIAAQLLGLIYVAQKAKRELAAENERAERNIACLRAGTGRPVQIGATPPDWC